MQPSSAKYNKYILKRKISNQQPNLHCKEFKKEKKKKKHKTVIRNKIINIRIEISEMEKQQKNKPKCFLKDQQNWQTPY